ncbi:dipeptide epimerase [Merismopedia glauca]|uniref:Dipeptide epimerase n=1 Tax=Merismopedia glauca CCAP 1448/3 TaxID=1296344 RepID=A0A2T1BWQ6_9CYAN|nr:dipeptide epimerase [Merismopedia glauca]PSB00445.1 dipeptide epimerase [Merismopedia glauca CCAP 1448/3]
MQISWTTFTVPKRFPLTISRGTTSLSNNVWVQIEADGIVGWGEAAPFSIGEHQQTTAEIVAILEELAPKLANILPWERQKIEHLYREYSVISAAQAAIDLAVWDWLGKKAKLPLWQLWGLDRSCIVPTSVTIGINPPEVARERVSAWLNLTQAKFFKVKLGNPLGIEADKAMLLAIIEALPPTASLSVDANGGWSVSDAIAMCTWLSQWDIKYVEQPLARGQEADLEALKKASALPIFADESCFTSQDIPKLADKVDGINIKVMKSGGLTEAIRMIHTAKACGLQIMFGCYSDSSLSNTAAAQLSSLADYLDLDSHLNLLDDPFVGATLQDGRLIPNDLPGLGVTVG